MNWQTAALALAGVIGGVTAVIHGVLVQRLMVRPIEASLLAEPRTPEVIRRLVPLLMQFSTFAWLLGAVALIVAARWFEPQARLVTGLLVGGLYLFGAVGNFWANAGRHPGWMLMAAALVLIVVGIV
ncbi:MAG: hypothetical protein ISP49_17695 [Reyranella sp.]|nr:hypothetical protein [Reyranella sp.]MBL6653433.1 hypothetical protein [Reyranella sp.]